MSGLGIRLRCRGDERGSSLYDDASKVERVDPDDIATERERTSSEGRLERTMSIHSSNRWGTKSVLDTAQHSDLFITNELKKELAYDMLQEHRRHGRLRPGMKRSLRTICVTLFVTQDRALVLRTYRSTEDALMRRNVLRLINVARCQTKTKELYNGRARHR